jgi:hypothetical protein
MGRPVSDRGAIAIAITPRHRVGTTTAIPSSAAVGRVALRNVVA